MIGRSRGVGRSWISVASLVAMLAVACSGPQIAPGVGSPIPRCADVPRIEAAAQMYRDAPIYVANEMPADEVREWASRQPGFESIWIDREHHGWLTVAFSKDASLRQLDLAQHFPGVGVVAVGVDWTHAELEALQAKVIRNGAPDVVSSGIYETQGVVGIGLGYLEPDKVARVSAKFAGGRVCLDGLDPNDAPAEGPQQETGDGWRLLADNDRIGPPYRTGIAADPESFAALWAAIGLAGNLPAVDFGNEVAIWFGAVHGSSCPRLRLDGVGVDLEHSIVYAEITHFEVGACTADAIGHAYVIAVDRAKLPHGPFTIQLEGGERPAGIAAEERTVVDADLTVPGSSLSPDQLHSAEPVAAEDRVEAGGYVEAGYPWRYRLFAHCGIEWLGELNDTWWRADLPPGEARVVPPEWAALEAKDGTIDLEIVLNIEPEPNIVATAGSHSVTYRPTAHEPPGCV